MRVAVIGAGVVGITTAYFLTQQGHQVSVIEQRGNVSEAASLWHAGLLGAAHLSPLAAPGMSKRVLSHWFNADHSLHLRPSINLAHWRWLRSWMRECTLERLQLNKQKMLRLGSYSQQLLQQMTHLHNLDFQQRDGVLHLFRTPKEHAKMSTQLALLTEAGLPFQLLDEAACRILEPALNPQMAFAGGLYLPQDGSGNCALFTKQLKMLLQQADTQFIFSSVCEQIQAHSNGVTLRLTSAEQTSQVNFDAVVIAAGADSLPLLKSLGLPHRMAQCQSYANTAVIKNIEDSPRLSIIDDMLAITRMDKRIRIAGTVHLGKLKTKVDESAWQTLRKLGADWFPDAANYHTAQNSTCRHLMTPDSTPVLGASAIKHVYLNLAHAENGWAMAAGSGKIIADQISGNQPEINLDL